MGVCCREHKASSTHKRNLTGRNGEKVLAWELGGHLIAAFTLHVCGNEAAALTALDSIALPVTESRAPGNDSRALLDADPIYYTSSGACQTALAAPTPVRSTQATIQRTAAASIGEHSLIDLLGADTHRSLMRVIQR